MDAVRRRSVTVLVVALAGIALSCAPAVAKVLRDPGTRHRFGFVPAKTFPRGRARAGFATSRQICFNECLPLTNHGGPVMTGQRIQLVFWEPPGYTFPAAFKAGMQKAVEDIGADSHTPGNVFGVAQEYLVSYAVSGAGAITVHDALPPATCTDSALPACVNDSQLRAELSNLVTSRGLAQGLGTAYVVLLPQNVGSCYDAANLEGEPVGGCAYTSFCAYHSFIPSGDTQIVYATLPWAYGSKCDAEKAFKLGYPHTSQIDPTVSLFAHELIESMNDPDLNSWYDSQQQEIADKCAQIWGPGGRYSKVGLATNGRGYYNQLYGGEPYLVTWEFSTRALTCTDRNGDTQPTGSITTSPDPPVPGQQTQFELNVSDPAAVANVVWTFADGSTAIGTTASGVYDPAHPPSVLVTDTHGNELLLPRRSTTTLTSSANPARTGAPVEYTATVSPAPGSGTATFSDGDSPIAGCESVPVSAGIATCATAYDAPAPHAILASYSGSLDERASQSSPLDQRVVDPAAYVATVRADGPVSLWRLAESAGPLANDEVGVDPGRYVGGVAFGGAGPIAGDSAPTFNGTGYVAVKDAAALHTGDSFSAEAWVRPARLGAAEGILSKGSWMVYLNTANKLVLYKPRAGVISIASKAITDLTRFHHVAVTKAGNAVHLYLDGADVTGGVIKRVVASSTSELDIGAGASRFKGAIADVAVYDHPLTPAQVQAHVAAAGG